MRALAIAALLLVLGTPARSADTSLRVVGHRVEAIDPTSPARSGAMLGSACSYRTATIARRVMAQGADYAYVGSLQSNTEAQGEVACPFRVGGQLKTCVVASELVEHLAGETVESEALSLEGRILEIDGVRYVVLTAYQPGAP